jgi:hypothetical protein
MPKKRAPAQKAKKTLEKRYIAEGRSGTAKKAAKRRKQRTAAKKAANTKALKKAQGK